MRTAIAFLALMLLAGLPARADGITSFTLENGLQGVVVEDHRAPVVTHMVWYRVGSADDPAGQSGLAHFLEHLMFKGTGTLADGEFSRIVRENGGEDNAFTSMDYTGYFQRIAADRLELVMSMEADRMVGLAPGAEAVLAERDVVLEERRQVVDSSPEGPFGELRRATLYLNHPYGRPIIGWAHEIAALDEEKALAFYRDDLGLRLTETITYQGHTCVFLRANTDHHVIALYPKALREQLGMSPHTTTFSFGFQLATYTQLRRAVDFLRAQGVSLKTLPPALFPGMGPSVMALDPDGHAIQLYHSMEQIGWDGQPRPASLRQAFDPDQWPDVWEGESDSYGGEVFLGPWN